MAKSALAVQVTFDPEVAAVFHTLNRMVFQSARKRLLATLCYALLDPQRRELLYASAGHLFPYRVTPRGQGRGARVGRLSARRARRVDDRAAHRRASTPGDTMLLLQRRRRRGPAARAATSTSASSASSRASRATPGADARRSRDGVLADLDPFTRRAPREDDVTVLVVRLP